MVRKSTSSADRRYRCLSSHHVPWPTLSGTRSSQLATDACLCGEFFEPSASGIRVEVEVLHEDIELFRRKSRWLRSQKCLLLTISASQKIFFRASWATSADVVVGLIYGINVRGCKAGTCSRNGYSCKFFANAQSVDWAGKVQGYEMA
jgi:hypothetical protein